MTVVDLADLRPRQLPPEPWGARLTRAREQAGFTLRTLEEAIDHHFSRGVVHRLEQMEGPPSATRDRRRAYMLLVIYGFDPADWDLGPDDIPPLVDLQQLIELGIRTGSFATALAAHGVDGGWPPCGCPPGPPGLPLVATAEAA